MTTPRNNSKDAPDKYVTKPRPIWRRQDDPRYQRASDIAAKAACRRDARYPFRDEDEMLDYMREIRSDIYNGY